MSAAEFVPGASPAIEDVSDGEQTSMSFAQVEPCTSYMKNTLT